MSDEFLKFLDLQKIVTLSRTTVWRLERKGAFPSRRQVGPSSVRWLRSEVEEWLETRPKVVRNSK